MKNTLVVVADLGCFKAFRLENHHPAHTARLEPVEEFNNAEAHGKLGDKVSDLSGRFPRTSSAAHSAGAMSDGERHNIELESRKRLVRQLAQQFNALARGKDVELLPAGRQPRDQPSVAGRTGTASARQDRKEHSGGPDEAGAGGNHAAFLNRKGSSGSICGSLVRGYG